MDTEEEQYDSEYSSDSCSYSKPEYADFSDDSISTTRKRYLLTEFKKEEKGYHTIKRIGKKGKKTIFEFYETAIFPKTLIRNAVTGEKYRGYFVGTNDENLFFKVTDSSAELKNKDPFILFYDNPEQWERHANVNCPTIIKNNWYVKFRNEMKKRKNPQFISILQEVEKLEQNKFYNFTSTLFSQNLFSPTLSSGENVNFNKETNIKTIEIK